MCWDFFYALFMFHDYLLNNVPWFCVVLFNPKAEKKCPDEIRIDVQVVIDFAI